MTRPAKKRRRPVKAATRHARAKKIGLMLLGGYQAQLAKQGGGCAICGKPPKPGGRRLNIDHAHATGEVRGLLCARCNRGLGWFADSPHLLFAAAAYLRYGWAAAAAYREANERFVAVNKYYEPERGTS
jgi:hypothetical protein